MLVGGTGAVSGAMLGTCLTQVLIKVRTGIVDPAPSAVTVSSGHLVALTVLIAACLAIVTATAVRVSGRGILTTLRRL